MNGRKRHLLVAGLGLVLLVVVHAASVQKQDGAKRVFERLQGRHPRLRLVWADAGYKVQWLLDWVLATCAWVLEIISRPDDSKGFVLLPRRWVLERTFGWLSHYRVLSKDYEVLPRNSEVVVYVAMIHLMVRRLACQPTTAPSCSYFSDALLARLCTCPLMNRTWLKSRVPYWNASTICYATLPDCTTSR